MYDEDKIISKWNKFEYGYWDSDTKRFRLWDRRNSSRNWAGVDYYNDVCKKNDTYFRALCLIMQNIDKDNVICFRHKRCFPPVTNDDDFMNLLCVCKTVFYKVKKWLKDNHLISEVIVDFEGKKTKRYYLSPIISLGGNGISIACYRLFREHIYPHLTGRQKDLLDRHEMEEYGENSLFFIRK
jgi:hypothetical protein|nr:MAG TPA: hypothetical protein [Caudoviricetes sp.]